jgi:hypothetical protein
MSSGIISLLGVWPNSIPINFEKLPTRLNGETLQKLKTLNLNPDFEFQPLLGSLKYVINIIMWIRDTGYYNPPS